MLEMPINGSRNYQSTTQDPQSNIPDNVYYIPTREEPTGCCSLLAYYFLYIPTVLTIAWPIVAFTYLVDACTDIYQGNKLRGQETLYGMGKGFFAWLSLSCISTVIAIPVIAMAVSNPVVPLIITILISFYGLCLLTAGIAMLVKCCNEPQVDLRQQHLMDTNPEQYRKGVSEAELNALVTCRNTYDRYFSIIGSAAHGHHRNAQRAINAMLRGETVTVEKEGDTHLRVTIR